VRGKLKFRVATDRSIRKIVNWQLCVPESRFIEMLIARTTVGQSQNRQDFGENNMSLFCWRHHDHLRRWFMAVGIMPPQEAQLRQVAR
jgi:hypothetical protein